MKLAMLVVALCLMVGSAAAQVSVSDQNYINNSLVPATGLLYSQDESGNMRMRCTATNIEKNATGYVYVTAAHCACKDDPTKGTTEFEPAFFFITTDDTGTKEFMSAKGVGCGYRTKGDDFVLFQVDTKKDIPVIAIGSDPKVLDRLVNVASPLGLGKQVFLGSVSSPVLNRPVVIEDINWTGVVLLQMFGVDGGSSGSSVICVDTHAICAFVVGSIDKTTMVAMPVSRLIALRRKIADGTYKYWKSETK